MTDDLDLRKQIAAEAQTESATAATPAVQAFQFFLVPLIIVAACVVIYLGLSALTGSGSNPQEWLSDIREGGDHSRWQAALRLTQSLRRTADNPDTSLTPELMSIFRDSDPDEHRLRRHLAECLGLLQHDLATDLLIKSANDANEHITVRCASLDALGTIKDPKSLPALVKLLDDENPVIRKYAAFNTGAAAGPTGDATAQEALRGKLVDVQPDVRWNAAFALAFFLGDRSGTDVIKKMLDRKYLEGVIGEDPNRADLTARVIFIACNAAAKLGDETFIPLLEERTDTAKEPKEDIRLAAHKALGKIRKTD